MIDHYNQYNITVYDLKKCVSFYRERIGLKILQDQDDYAYFVFGKTEMGLALISVKTVNRLFPEAKFPPSVQRTHQSFLSIEVEDVD